VFPCLFRVDKSTLRWDMMYSTIDVGAHCTARCNGVAVSPGEEVDTRPFSEDGRFCAAAYCVNASSTPALSFARRAE
jgi:hypothetical protein